MKLFSATLLDELAARASTSPRLRAHHNVHADASDLVQRFFVAMSRDSYIRPHRHASRSELVVVVRGAFDLIAFDDRGTVLSRDSVGEETGQLGYETPCATWHSLLARADGAAFLEVKEGPYDPATSVEFAPWAPPEGDALVPEFMRWMRAARVGERPASGTVAP